MDSTPLVTTLNISFTLTIGVISLLIVFSTYKRMEEDLLKEFSRRLMLVILILVLYVIYWGMYSLMLYDVGLAIYPLYLALIFVFLYLIWTVMSFERLSEEYGYSADQKLDKIGKQEEID